MNKVLFYLWEVNNLSRNWIILLILLTVIMAGCTSKTVTTEDGTEVEMNVPDSAKDDWCPTGASWQTSNPQSGESISMKVIGTVTVSGVEMCKATFKSNVDEEFAEGEYLWSEDGEVFTWTFYDATGKVVSKMEMKDGKMTITDEEGNVQTFDSGGNT
jgi:hypothetical protein